MLLRDSQGRPVVSNFATEDELDGPNEVPGNE